MSGQGKNGKNGKNRAWIELDGDALAANVRAFRALLPRECGVMAVVKANAYGHGAAAVSRRLEAEGVRRFAVASAGEALELRDAGINGEILILGYTAPDYFPLVERLGAIQTAADAEHAALIEAYGRERGTALPVHIAVDTGMSRIGFAHGDTDGMARLCDSPNLRVTGIFSHLCAADSDDEDDEAFTREQARRFSGVVSALRARGADPGLAHLSASYAAVNYDFPFDCARLGILMYGVLNSPGDRLRRPLDLSPVLTLRARIVSVREIAEGDSVGYGRTFRAAGPVRVATLAIGYADGLPRCLSGGRLRAIVRGQFAPGIGRICMDQMMLDVSGIPDARAGDEATIIGRSGGLEIRAEELADASGSISHELFSRLGARIEREP